MVDGRAALSASAPLTDRRVLQSSVLWFYNSRVNPPTPSEFIVLFRDWLIHYWDAPREKSKWTDVGMILLTTGIAAAAFWSAWVFNNQLAVMREQLEVTDRPWIRAEPQVSSPITFQENGNLAMDVTFVLDNVGRSVATDVTVYAGAFVPKWEGSEHFSRPLERQVQLCGKVQPHALTITLFPDEIKQFNVGLRISRKEIEANIVPPPPGIPNPPPGKRTDPILFGCVDYRFSNLPEHHQTGFVYNIVRTDPKTPNVPYLIVVGDTLPAANTAFENWGFGGDYAD